MNSQGTPSTEASSLISDVTDPDEASDDPKLWAAPARLILRIVLLIGNVQVCVMPYIILHTTYYAVYVYV